MKCFIDGRFPGIYAVVGTAAAIFACFVMDRFGRRQLFSKSSDENWHSGFSC